MEKRSNKNADHIRTHASKKLRTNLRILAIVFSILLFITVYELFTFRALFSEVVIAILIGLFAGFISSRMYKISWDKDEARVVGRIDIYGVVALILFILFELNKGWIASLFSNGAEVGAISLLLLTSALFGRVIGTSRRILRILSEERII